MLHAPWHAALTVLEDTSLEINRGELVALVAPSGAGKTSLLKAVRSQLVNLKVAVSQVFMRVVVSIIHMYQHTIHAY